MLSLNFVKRPFFLTNSRLSATLTRSLFIQTATTPNEQALKFLPSTRILPDEQTKEYLSGRDAYSSPLAKKLFSIDDISSVMFGSNFITIAKKTSTDWSILKPEIFSILTEYLTNGKPIIDKNALEDPDTIINENDDEITSIIKELIFTRIRPAIQDDGGDIEFISFDSDIGKVRLKLKGACRTCDSSSVTLKNGVESMLKYYIEEVKIVEQINEDDDLIDPLPDSKKSSTIIKSKEVKSKELDDDIPPSL
ncbi:NifU family protein [Ascoidea rubescens DSM 1968]|uniref:HIRA-interacting protein 5 n=1 Tax=Ascoidea rubescens DSM 1968 TaxID=1344418 RepID=A0A1D2V8I7_9ASCO|nr:HIRA-interacting protein 5 [Ascoidea rubescens DSM 1968]ODV57918.1 HIRA-interacting protein 5 [Ascoidea rubescens DSM 1968]